MTYPLTAFLTVATLISIAVLYLWVSRRIETKQISYPLVVFAFVYVLLAHFTMLSGLMYSTEYANAAPCENVVVNSTDTSSTVTSYTYEDSCASRGHYALGNFLIIIYLWTAFLVILTLGYIGMYYTYLWLRSW